MTQKIPWLRVVAEGVVIVASILLAFAIDAWWAKRQDQILELQYLGRLSEDLGLGMRQLDLQFERPRNAHEASRTLAMAMDEGLPSVTDSALVQQFAIAARTGFVEAQLDHAATYRELQATGRLTIVSNPTFRNALADYYSGIGVLSQSILLELNQGAAARYHQLTGRRSIEVERDPSLLSAAARRRLLEELRSSPEFARELRQFSAIVTLDLSRIQTLRASADSLGVALGRF